MLMGLAGDMVYEIESSVEAEMVLEKMQVVRDQRCRESMVLKHFR